MNPRVLEIPSSLIRAVAAKRKATSIDLGLGEPSLPPNMEHFTFAMEAVAKHGIKYSANAGYHDLRESIARYYHYPDMHSAGNVCVTTGSQEAMYVTIKTLLDPAKDELLVVEPAFPAYVKMATLENVAVRSVPMLEDDDFAIDAERILEAIGEKTRAIVICSPSNPTGRILSRGQAELLVRGLAKRGGAPIWLIHDEIYREQTFTNDAAYLAELYPYTIVTNSLSKSNALTGLRLGWILAPHAFVEQAIKAHAWVTSCADSFAQNVALHVFTTLEGVREHAPWYIEQRTAVAAALRESRLRALPIDGSFYACVRLPDGMGSLDAAMELIESHDVIAIPGAAFGPTFESWLRLSWVAPVDRVREGISRIEAYCAAALSS
jgi:aspartate aminotransferase